jgi:hypothetical protein
MHVRLAAIRPAQAVARRANRQDRAVVVRQAAQAVVAMAATTAEATEVAAGRPAADMVASNIVDAGLGP